jgi:hypothetical protein
LIAPLFYLIRVKHACDQSETDLRNNKTAHASLIAPQLGGVDAKRSKRLAHSLFPHFRLTFLVESLLLKETLAEARRLPDEFEDGRPTGALIQEPGPVEHPTRARMMGRCQLQQRVELARGLPHDGVPQVGLLGPPTQFTTLGSDMENKLLREIAPVAARWTQHGGARDAHACAR